MIGALTQRQGQFRTGKYLGKSPNVASAPFFTYEQIGDKERRYNQIIQNLITTEESIIVKTNYRYDWRVRNWVQLQDGSQYIITAIKQIEDEVNPQAFAILKEGTNVYYYIELTQGNEHD